jgi:hypothetical protein
MIAGIISSLLLLHFLGDVIYNIRNVQDFPHTSELSFNVVTWRLKTGMVEPEQTSIAEQRLGNYVPAKTNSNELVFAR